MSDVGDLIAEQVAYYRARAPEYDDWWRRAARYDMGQEFRDAWEADITRLEQEVKEFHPTGRVLEIAAGTGNWTRLLAETADRVVAVDVASEALAINAERNGSHPVEFVEADVFDYEPGERFDVVAFFFWLCHVPDSRFEAFWSLVDRALAPGGRVFFADSAHPDHVAATGPPIAGDVVMRAHVTGTVDCVEEDWSLRRLHDGRTFRIVKRYWWPDQLRLRLADLGWDMSVVHTDWAFLYGSGTRRPGGF